MIYLDSAATSLYRPTAVERAVIRAMRTMANPGRGGHVPAMHAAETVYSCREERACGPEGTRKPKEAREGAEVKGSQGPKEKPERSAADETKESEGRTERDVL